jgi:lipid-A-disaccharide synthase
MIAKSIVKIRYISLGNLIIDKLAFRELIQKDCNSEALVAEIRALIENEQYRNAMLKDYALIRETLGGSGASSAVARAMIDELKAI